MIDKLAVLNSIQTEMAQKIGQNSVFWEGLDPI